MNAFTPNQIVAQMLAKQSENELQFDCVQALRKMGVFISASANGIKTTGKQMNQMKNRGLVVGFPDLHAIGPGPRHVFIELKTKTGKTSVEQLMVHATLRDMGCEVFTCTSVDEVVGIFQ